MEKKQIIENIANYYTEKLQLYGATPRGVDWNSLESQEMRFEQLCKVIQDSGNSFSILDYGCGFGAMLNYVKEKFNTFKFVGFDISEEMVKKSKEIFAHEQYECMFIHEKPLNKVDYVVSSGIFNVRLQHNDSEWQSYILETLHEFDRLSDKGFSFNMLTSYSDKEFMRDYLYYASPTFFFDYCKRNFSKKIAILHDYPLFEFTILVRK